MMDKHLSKSDTVNSCDCARSGKEIGEIIRRCGHVVDGRAWAWWKMTRITRSGCRLMISAWHSAVCTSAVGMTPGELAKMNGRWDEEKGRQ